MVEENIKPLSVRIKNSNSVLGSGVLFLPNGDNAYVFTAAHLFNKLNDDYELVIECYCDCDNSNVDDYIFQVSKNDFKLHREYPGNEYCDIAGIQLEKRYWMYDRRELYVASAVKKLDCKCVGYPYMQNDETIKFATSVLDLTVDDFSYTENRLRMKLISNAVYDATDLVEALSGMSGSGLFCNEIADAELLLGIWKSSQGANASNGFFFSVLYPAIIGLCRQEGWIEPKLKKIIETKIKSKDNKLTKTQYSAVDADVISNEEKTIIEDADESIKAELDNIIDLMHANKFDSAIEACNTLEKKIQETIGLYKEKAQIKLYLANCYMQIWDFEKALTYLTLKKRFPKEQCSFAYLMEANLKMLTGNLDEAQNMTKTAIELDENNIQAVMFDKYLDILKSNECDEAKDISSLENCLNIESLKIKDKCQIYTLIANLLIIKYNDFERAIEYHCKERKISGSSKSTLAIADCYYQLFLNNNNDVVYCSCAVDYYLMLLYNAEKSQREAFFKNKGCIFINCLVYLNRNDLILEYVNEVIRNTASYQSVKDLKIVRANSATLLGRYDESYSEGPTASEITAIQLFYRSKVLEVKQTNCLDTEYGIIYDKNHGGYVKKEDELALKDEVDSLTRDFERLADDMIKFIDSNAGQKRLIKQIYVSLLNLLLQLKYVEKYDIYLAQALSKYPNDKNFIMYKALKSEINGNLKSAEDGLEMELDAGINIYNAKEAISFYMRNKEFEKLEALYKRILDSDAGNFNREELIFAYISFLSIPLQRRQYATQEYFKYRKELSIGTQLELESNLGIIGI